MKVIKVGDIVVYKATTIGVDTLGVRVGIVEEIFFSGNNTVYHIRDRDTDRIVTRRLEILKVQEFIEWLTL